MLPSLGGYITADGSVNLARVEAIVARIGLVEDNIFRRRAIEDRKFESYKRQQEVSGASEASADEHLDEGSDTGEMLATAAILSLNEAVVAASGAGEVCLGKDGYKDRYYAHKLREADSAETRRDMVVEYTKGLLWVAQYYSQGVPSWQWFYPYHYAPFAADMVNLGTVVPNFTLGKPFSPLEQLMAVLPAASAHCVPAAYRPLMEAPESPIADCYPRDFELDPNGKPATLTWLWVARLPFIDAPRLLAALAERAPHLTVEERARNQLHGSEVSACEHHPLASDAVRKLAEQDWVDIAGLALGGRVKTPVVVRSGGSGLVTVRYTYEQAQKGFHTSRLDSSFTTFDEPLTWEEVMATVPRRRARLPIFDDELEAMLRGERPLGKGKGKGKGKGNGGSGRGGGMDSNACYACGETGHRIAQCPNVTPPPPPPRNGKSQRGNGIQ
jgi:5'-3' exoribonuclease 2